MSWRIGEEGDRLWKCHACGRFKVEDTRAETEAATAAAEQRLQRRGYVCRPHYAQVNWQGAGCQRCAAEIAMSKAQRRSRRTEAATEW
ncbi:hypothetical protein [Terrabacter lapilli]